MKNVKVITLITVAILFMGLGNVKAQESSSVMITTVAELRKITLQVVNNENLTTVQEFKRSDEKTSQAILKEEMDEWIKKGYHLSQAFGYSEPSPTGVTTVHTRYEILILIKTE